MTDRRDDELVDRRGDNRLSPDEVKALKQIARLSLTLRFLLALLGACVGIAVALINLKDSFFKIH